MSYGGYGKRRQKAAWCNYRETWRDYADIGEVTGNGPEDDNYDPDFD